MDKLQKPDHLKKALFFWKSGWIGQTNPFTSFVYKGLIKLGKKKERIPEVLNSKLVVTSSTWQPNVSGKKARSYIFHPTNELWGNSQKQVAV
jgi:hypothetical protein